MKIKKEYIILGVVLAALSIYIATQRTGRRHYDLPVLTKVSAKDITKIEIARPGETLILQRQGEQWTLTDKAYPASDAKIQDLLKVIENLSLSALVSESQSYERYDLGPERKITVKAWAGTDLVREFEVGKAASSFSHTFLKLPNDTKIYQAQNNFRDDFENPLDTLRDKKVLTYKEDDITGLTLARSGGALEFTRKEIPPAETEKKEPAEKSGADAAPESPPAKKYEWVRTDGKAVDNEKVSRAVNTFSGLLCQKFIEGKATADFKNPEITLTLKAGEATHTLSIFPKEVDSYPAVSSQSPYPFDLSAWQVDNLLENLDPKPKSEKPEGKAPASAKDDKGTSKS